MSATGNYIGSVEILEAYVKDLTAERNATQDPNRIEEINQEIDTINKILQNASDAKRR